ncbi:hypothetical protein Q7A53_05520 [Halobacillus rhizosphaerae]|uniref:hypothetical protein n=1 Tax=Halobacillus rhizosphaerae TaxID=3064889 RepID=UPI00398BB492
MKHYSKEELINFNELLLGRGAPVTHDGKGYNKADFGACSTYYYGLSNAQIVDLAKRLEKYCKTQLGADKEKMVNTKKHFEQFVENSNFAEGISIEVREEDTLIAFRYNEMFIHTIKTRPNHLRYFDQDAKSWVVKNEILLKILNDLKDVGGDVENALQYAKDHPFLKNPSTNKIVINCNPNEQFTALSFKYDKQVVEAIKTIDKEKREYDPDKKTWIIRTEELKSLKLKLQDKCNFKAI